METILRVESLCKNYDNTQILDHICLEVKKGEFLAIMGRSGSGKSTLLYGISGMDRPTSGEVFLHGENIAALGEAELSNIRLKKMGFVFQQSYLLKNLSIRDNILLPAFKAGTRSREQVRQWVDSLVKKTGIIEVADHDITKVSGGQLQRAAICRALVNRPDILFGDEPTGALNSSTTYEIMNIINDINEDGREEFGGRTVILVTHDTKVASRAERVIFLSDGCICDELSLGKYESNRDNQGFRERKLTEWLEKQGF